jgi:hypothetical protein
MAAPSHPLTVNPSFLVEVSHFEEDVGSSATVYNIRVLPLRQQKGQAQPITFGSIQDVKRRYSEFFKLHSILKHRFPAISRFQFPKKILPLPHAHPNWLKERRREAFDSFLKTLVSSVYPVPPELLAFLCLDNSVTSAHVTRPPPRASRSWLSWAKTLLFCLPLSLLISLGICGLGGVGIWGGLCDFSSLEECAALSSMSSSCYPYYSPFCNPSVEENQHCRCFCAISGT